MSDYKKQTLAINKDLLVEIHYNPNISKEPYDIRFYGYDSYTHHRVSSEDLLKLSERLADFVLDNSSTADYNDNITGLARLWHNRRNEAVEQLERLQND